MSSGEFDLAKWGKSNQQDILKLLQIAPFVLIGLAVLYIGWKGIYTVEPHEQAVVLRFGEYQGTQGPGLHFMIPLVDEAVLVNTAEQSMRLPYGADPVDEPAQVQVGRTRNEESLILTGDLYAGLVEWNVNWRIVDPEKFLFSIASRHVDGLITAVARSVMHRAVGDYSADEILTGKREEIGLAAHEEMQAVLDSYDCGINIVDLQMQRVTPPERVKPSFDEVNASIQQKDKLVNEARRERNRLIPQANATRDQLIQSSNGYAARRIAEADGEIQALKAKYAEYKQAPGVTRQRLYLEAMERIIANSGPKTVLDSDLKGLLPFLNLNETEQKQPMGRSR